MSGFNDGLKKPVSGGGGAAAETVDLIAGETIAAGQLVYQAHGAAGTQGRVYLTDSGNSYSSNLAAVIGVATTSAAAGASVTVQYTGVVSGLSGLTADLVYSPSTTPGALAANGEEPMIGVAESATELRLTGVVSGLSGLTNGVAYGSNASGVLTAGQNESIGYAISSTELLIRMEYGATEPAVSAYSGPAPTAYWRMNETSGTTINDSSDNSLGPYTVSGATFINDATFPGGTRYVLDSQGVFGGGFTATSLPAGVFGKLSVAFWWNADAANDGWFFTGSSTGPFVRIHNIIPPFVSWHDNFSYDDPATSMVNGSWVHWTFTQDGSTYRIYRNGVLDGGPFTSSLRNRATSVGIMRNNFTSSSSTRPNGQVCEFLIWDATLSATEALQVYDSTKTPGGLIWS